MRPIGAPYRALIDADDLVEMFDSVDAVAVYVRVARAVEFCGELGVQYLVDEAALAAARDAGDRDEFAERYLDVNVFEVVLARAAYRQILAAARPAHAGDGDALPARQICAGDRLLALLDVIRSAADDDLAAVDARAGSYVDDPICALHRLFVVLDDNEGVAEIAQTAQRREQFVVVALMQSYARLVEDVEHAHEPASYLRRQPDALRLSARQRTGRPAQRQIAQADVSQKVEARIDLFEDLIGDDRLALAELQLFEKLYQFDYREIAEFPDVLAADKHGERLGFEPLAVAYVAGHVAHVPLYLHLDEVGRRLAVAAAQIGDHALEVAAKRRAEIGGIEFVFDLSVVAVEYDVLDALGQVLERRAQTEPVLASKRSERAL